MIVLLWSHFADKLKHLSSANRYTCPTPILNNLEHYPLLSRGYHPMLLRPMNFSDGVIPFPVIVTPWVLGCLQTETTEQWIDSTRWFSTPSTLLLGSWIPHHIIPSLIGYIFIVPTFNCATWSLCPEQLSTMSEAYIDLPHLIISPWTTSLISSLCHTRGFNNFSLHHSFDLMSSPIDYIFMKSLDNCVMIIINIQSSSRISIEFMMRNTILAPRWFVLSSTTFLPSPQHKLVHIILEIHPFWHVDGLQLNPSATSSSFSW
jgi:hypothetical protein